MKLSQNIDFSKYSKQDFSEALESLLKHESSLRGSKIRELRRGILYFTIKYKIQVEELLESPGVVFKKIETSDDSFDFRLIRRFKEEVLQCVGDLEELVDNSGVVRVNFSIGKEGLIFFDIGNAITKYGYDRKDFLTGKVKLFDLILDEDKARVQDEFEANHENKKEFFNTKFRIKTKDGEIKHFDVNVSVNYDNNGKPITIDFLMNDITEFDKNKARLKDIEIALETFAVLTVDLDGFITSANPGFHSISGNDQSVVGTHTREMGGEIYGGQTWGEMKEIIYGGKVWNGIVKNPKKDGSGEFYYVDTTITPIHDENGNIKEFKVIRTDVTEIMKLKYNFKSLNDEYSEVLNSTEQLFWVVDQKGVIMNVNASFIRKLGYKRKEIIGKKIHDFVSNKSLKVLNKNLGVMENTRNRVYELTLLCKDGSSLPVILKGTSLFDKNGKFIKAVGFLTDISELKRIQEELRIASTIDALTGVYNRHEFKDIIPKLYQLLNEREIQDLSMVVFDIDNFKRINDTYGHLVGDEVLEYIGEILKKLSEDNTEIQAFRLGGEEFGIIGIDLSGEELYKIIEKLRIDFSIKVFKTDLGEFNFTISAGVGAIKGGEGRESLYKKADDAAKKAKEAGKNQVIMG